MDLLRSTGLEELEATQAIKLCTQAAVQNNFPFILWKSPNQLVKNFIVDLSGKEKLLKPDLNALAPGFLVSPFLNENNSNTTYIKADLHYQFQDGSFLGKPVLSSKSERAEKFEKAVTELNSNSVTRLKYYPSANKNISSDKKDYINLVNLAKEKIHQEKLDKLVPSKIKLVELSPDFDYVSCFLKLCDAYPNAMVSVVATPQLGTWIGATPEMLVSMNEEGVFKTVSLAGTQEAPQSGDVTQDIGQTSWTQKEIEEQALVSRYIINCFKKIRLREYEERGPKTVKAGNLMHLKTDFTVDTKTVGFPELATIMLELLHPTSAVCGMPRQASLDFIKENETFDRKLYSGYLGPVNLLGETCLFVNLRCMSLSQQQALIYAGAGVTADSNPEKEWLETELKCETLLNILSSYL